MNNYIYIDKAVFLNDLQYMRDQQIALDDRSDLGKQKLKDINWFIRLVENYPKYGYDLS